MLWQNNISFDIKLKARNLNITGFLVIVAIIFIIDNPSVKAVFYIPKTNIIGFSNGIYYDNLDDINKFFVSNDLPKLEPEYQFYTSLYFRTNFIPLIFEDSHSIIYSMDFRIPCNRKVQVSGNEINLNTYSFFTEFSSFESYLKPITVHPFVGLGYSFTKMEIKLTDNKQEIFQKLSSEEMNFEFSKSTLLFNLGGGIDYRTNLKKLTDSKINLLFSFNARYSMCLNAFRINDSNWKYNNATVIDLPNYYAPGLSIELGLAIEYQIND
jgi:hypothetical protein